MLAHKPRARAWDPGRVIVLLVFLGLMAFLIRGRNRFRCTRGSEEDEPWIPRLPGHIPKADDDPGRPTDGVVVDEEGKVHEVIDETTLRELGIDPEDIGFGE